MVSVAKPAFFAEYASFYKITCRSRASLTPYHDTKTQISSVFGPNDAIAPFQTDMNATSIFTNKHFMDQVLTKLPMRRIGQPSELVGPIVFLASAASSMITGLVLPVDGGAAATCPIEWKPQL